MGDDSSNKDFDDLVASFNSDLEDVISANLGKTKGWQEHLSPEEYVEYVADIVVRRLKEIGMRIPLSILVESLNEYVDAVATAEGVGREEAVRYYCEPPVVHANNIANQLLFSIAHELPGRDPWLEAEGSPTIPVPLELFAAALSSLTSAARIALQSNDSELAPTLVLATSSMALWFSGNIPANVEERDMWHVPQSGAAVVARLLNGASNRLSEGRWRTDLMENESFLADASEGNADPGEFLDEIAAVWASCAEELEDSINEYGTFSKPTEFS